MGKLYLMNLLMRGDQVVMSRRRLLCFMVASFALLLISACGGRQSQTVEDTAGPPPRPTLPGTWTPSPTWTPVRTPRPTRTPTPADTPTLTPTLEPLATRTPAPTLSPTPTWTPISVPSTTPELTIPAPLESPAGRGCVGKPASDNLLVNGDFEQGQHAQPGFDTIQVPDGWEAFWRAFEPVAHDPENQDGYQPPFMRLAMNVPPFDDPPRIHGGFQAVLIYGPQRVFDAGIWQQVQVEPGQDICLTAYGHAWSAMSEDRYQSTLNTDDDRRNANFLLGIDPQGGIEPFATSVVWSDVGHIYDVYAPIPSIQVQAASQTVTVFVRVYSLWRFPHNDFYFDSVSLVIMGSP